MSLAVKAEAKVRRSQKPSNFFMFNHFWPPEQVPRGQVTASEADKGQEDAQI